MNIYEFGIVFLFILVFINFSLRNVRLKGQNRTERVLSRNDYSNRKIFYIPMAVYLIFITGFRNNMHTDYVSYQYNYEVLTKEMTLKEILSQREALFGVLQKIIGEISGYNTIFFMTILAILTVYCLTKTIVDYSDMVWMSFFLLLTMGSYYTCFNTTRSYLAAAIFFWSCKYIYERNFLKYFLCILLISLLHISSLVFLPMYWILPIRWNKKRNLFLALAVVLITIYLFFQFKSFVSFVTNFVYTVYEVGEGKVMSSQNALTIVRPLLFFVVVLVNVRAFDYNNRKERCWFNAVIYWMIISMFATQISLVQRFTYYVMPFAFLAIPLVITRSTNRKKKNAWIAIFIICGIVYSVLGQFQESYSFYWEENVSYLNM